MASTEIIFGDRSPVQVPELWEKHNWELPYALLNAVTGVNFTRDERISGQNQLISSGFDAKRALHRRSLTRTADRTIPEYWLRYLLPELYAALGEYPGMVISVATSNVEGWRDGTYTAFHQPRYLRATLGDTTQLDDIIQGQAWAVGSGIAVLISVDSAAYHREIESDVKGAKTAECTSARESTYVHALIDAGRIAQRVVLAGLRFGAVARMTPALKESLTQRLFHLHPEIHPIHFVRLAVAYEDPRR